MTLDEAIKHCEEIACNNTSCALEHKQLAEWLSELKKRRILDSLPEESTNEDLEEAAKQHSKQTFNGLLVEDNIAAFKAGAEWQKQQMKETLQTEYEKGRFDMREEMMKTLIGGEIVKDIHNQLSVKSEPLNDTFGKFGDKVKIIIVKEEQQ